MLGKNAQSEIAIADGAAYFFIPVLLLLGYFFVVSHYADVNSSIINSKIVSVDNDLSLLNVMRSESCDGVLMSELLRQGLKDSAKFDLFKKELRKKIGSIVVDKNSYDFSIDNGETLLGIISLPNTNIDDINNPNDKCPTSIVPLKGKSLVLDIESDMIIPYDDGKIIKLKLKKMKCE